MTARVKKRSSVGARIIDGLREAVAFEHGETGGSTVTRAPMSVREASVAPARIFTKEHIVELRERLRLSQPVFAQALNVSPETVKKWEQGTRAPDGAALRLLEVADEHPAWLLSKVRRAGDVSAARSRAPSAGAKRTRAAKAQRSR